MGGMTMNKNDKKREFYDDLDHQGREKVSLDVDRYINEGLAGGTVYRYGDLTNIEQARNLDEEEKPQSFDH